MPTDQGNVTKLAYGTIGGVLLFSSSGMPQDTATWSQINSMPLCWATTYLTAVHTCRWAAGAGGLAPALAPRSSCTCNAHIGMLHTPSHSLSSRLRPFFPQSKQLSVLP